MQLRRHVWTLRGGRRRALAAILARRPRNGERSRASRKQPAAIEDARSLGLVSPVLPSQTMRMTAETYGPRTAAWRSLASHADRLEARSFQSLFDENPKRFAQCSREAQGFLLDFSRELIDAEGFDLLLELAEQT